MSDRPARWIDDLPPALTRHAGILRRLLSEVRGDQRVRILVVGCSIGRGVADEHSDIDASVAVVPDAWPGYVSDLTALFSRLGGVVDSSHKRVTPAGGDPYELAWVVFSDGVQLELGVARAQHEVRPRRDWIVLHDPDGRVKDPQPDRYATLDDVREWAYDGWSTLLLCAKYLTRGSLWEANETLHLARTRAWRLWAAARRIPDPQYGLTAVLDSADPSPPPGIEATHAPLEPTALAGAALACADLLNALWTDATTTLSGSALPLPPAADAARRRLERV